MRSELDAARRHPWARQCALEHLAVVRALPFSRYLTACQSVDRQCPERRTQK